MPYMDNVEIISFVVFLSAVYIVYLMLRASLGVQKVGSACVSRCPLTHSLDAFLSIIRFMNSFSSSLQSCRAPPFCLDFFSRFSSLV